MDFFNENVNFLLRTHLCRIICEYLNASYRSLYCQCLFVVRKIDAAKGHTTTYVSSKHTHTLHKTHLCLMNIKWHFNLSFIGCEGLPLCIQMNSLFVKKGAKMEQDGRWRTGMQSGNNVSFWQTHSIVVIKRKGSTFQNRSMC